MNTLELLQQAKLYDLLPGCNKRRSLEASGVFAQKDYLFIIFDNLSQIGKVNASLKQDEANILIGDETGKRGFEDIAYSAADDRYYVLVEAVRSEDGVYHAEVAEYDRDLKFQLRRRLSTPFERANKGFEGLTCLRRNDGADYLLALCEGNRCKGGSAGRIPGNGRIQIFRKAAQDWEHVGTLRLPKSAQFVDYSSIDVNEGRVAVLSQTSAKVWIGTLGSTEWRFADKGIVWDLPRRASAKTPYCTPEGIAWLGPDLLAVVSDRRKKGAPKRCQTTDESLHIFRLPSRGKASASPRN